MQNKALLLDITIVNPCASYNLEMQHTMQENTSPTKSDGRKATSFPAIYSLPPLTMLTRGEVGSDVHALIKELAIR